MTEFDNKPKKEIIVTPENISDWRGYLASGREHKNWQDVTLNLARVVRGNAEAMGGMEEDVAHLWWEEALIGQHIYMIERDKPSGFDKERAEYGFQVMFSATDKARDYVEEKGLDGLIKISERFLGRKASYSGKHKEAETHYRNSSALYSKEKDPVERSRTIELGGFLAHSLIMNGKLNEGMELAKKSYKLAFESEGGDLLKEADYATWAIWTSGIPIHTLQAVIETESDLKEPDKKIFETMLDEAEEILKMPKGQETWADKDFQLRKDSISKIRGKMR